jgi:hypothetical protein
MQYVNSSDISSSVGCRGPNSLSGLSGTGFPGRRASNLGLGQSGTPTTSNRVKMNFSYKESVAEVVEEDKHEDDDHGGMVNLRRRQAKFKMLQDKNEFNKKCKRNRSSDFLKEKGVVKYSTMHYIGDVSEDDEELISDSSFEKQQQQTDQNKNTSKGKIYSLGYLSKNIWNNKIYSDDFDVDFEILKNDQIQRFKLGSVVNSAIQEDVESEMAN